MKKFNLIINWIGVIAFPLLCVLAIIDDGDSWIPSKWFYCMLLILVAMDFLKDIFSDKKDGEL